MAQNFLPCDREQELLLPPSLREWLPEDHLASFVIDAVEAMDLDAFYADYREDGWGRAAHEPTMMVALLLYAYAIGERSSRGLERRCREDVAFRVICANRTPDHATIARFRVRHEQALADTFTQVLRLCQKAGLVSVGLLALDGSLVAGNAAAAATRSYRAIRQEVEAILEEAARADAWEDERLGPGPRRRASRRAGRARLAPGSPTPLPGGARGRAGPLRGRPGLAICMGGRARAQARRTKAHAVRPRGARGAHDQHYRSRHAPARPTGRASSVR